MQDATQPLSLAFKLVSCAVNIRIESGKSFLVCLRRQPLGKDLARQREGYHAMYFSINFIVLLQRSCAKPPVAKFNIRCGESATPKGITLFTYRPNNKTPTIR